MDGIKTGPDLFQAIRKFAKFPSYNMTRTFLQSSQKSVQSPAIPGYDEHGAAGAPAEVRQARVVDVGHAAEGGGLGIGNRATEAAHRE